MRIKREALENEIPQKKPVPNKQKRQKWYRKSQFINWLIFHWKLIFIKQNGE